MEPHQRSVAQTQAIGVSLGKYRTQQLVEKKSGFEVGAGGSELDPANLIAQVQLFAVLGRWTEEALQAPAQIGGLADVRRGLGIVGAEEKNGGSGGDGSEEFGIAGGNELKAVGKHEVILSGFYWGERRNSLSFRFEQQIPGTFSPRRARLRALGMTGT
jgi:hypothetical protein